MLIMLFALLAAQPAAEQRTRPETIAEKTAPVAKMGKQSHPIIQTSLYNGRYIRLSDDSLWEINPSDTSITQSWITPVEIIATPSNDANYPYRLTNSLTGSSVLARPATSVPKTIPQSSPSIKK